MSRRFRQLVSWVTLAQVVLVGGLGTGLHGLLGCEHGPKACCEQGLCLASRCSAETQTHDCVFCRARESQERDRAAEATGAQLTTVDGSITCDGCAVCDLIDQYQTASPFQLDSPAVEPAADRAALQIHNAVVSAATRLALSRGPPAV